MIYTVTLNPALDIVFYSDELKTSEYNSTSTTQKFPGGKAINVSRTLYNLGIPSVATGFLGGYPGKFIFDWFNNRKVENYFVEIEQDTRINVRIKTKNDKLTIAGVYPSVTESQIDQLLFFLSRVREGDIVVMGGSVPSEVSPTIYQRLIDICNANKAYFVIDIPPVQMMDSLRYRPLLIKPNAESLALMFNRSEPFSNEEEIIEHGLKCIKIGARNVIVSMGEEGSYLFTEDLSVYRSYAVKGVEVNSFNSRDAMIGAFIGLYMKKNDPVESFKMASAAASATAFVEDIASKSEILDAFEKTVVKKIR